mgnify:CR=1 FL=1
MTALQVVNVPLVNYQTGDALPGATLTVYKRGTVTKASLYDLSGSPRSNPMTADSSGLAQFQVRAGLLYDVVWSLGSYTSPRLIVGGDATGLLAILAAFPETFGAAGDGTTDDKTAIELAAASLGSSGGTVLLAPGTVYRVSSLTIPSGVTIRGTVERPDLLAAQSAASLANQPGLALDSTGTITLSTNAALTHCFVKRYGMSFPDVIGNYAGTAITQNGDACVVRNCLVVGFNKILAQTGTSVSRYVVEGLYADGLNGLWIDKPSYDSSIVRDTRIYPYAQQPSVVYSTMVKSGYGFYFAAGQDNTIVDNCLAWGFFHNYHFQGTSAMQIGTIWSDYPTSVATSGQVGVYLGPNVSNIGAGNLQIWGGQVGLSQNSNNTETFFASMLTVVSTSSHAIVANGGELMCPVVKLQNIGGNGVSILNSGSHVVLRGYALNVTGTLVSVPFGGSPSFIDVDLKTDPYYTPNGTALFGGAGMVPYSVASASTMALPANGDMFTVTGTTTINSISGGWGTRRVLLRFASAVTVSQSGNISLAAGALSATSGMWLSLIYDAVTSKWTELARGPLPASGSTDQYSLDGMSARTSGAIFSAPSGLFMLGGAIVALSSLLTFSSAAKYTVGLDGNYILNASNGPAWDWSTGRRRLLIEAIGSTNYWTNSEDLTLAVRGGCTVPTVAANSLFGILALATVEQTTTNVVSSISAGVISCVSGDVVSFTVALLAVGSKSDVYTGIYDGVIGWGVNADSTCAILSGPGTESQVVGGLWSITGLSTTVPTLVRVTRTMRSTAGAQPFVYLNTGGAGTAGDQIKMGRPQFERGIGSSYIPSGASPTARAADVVTAASGLLALLTAASAALAARGAILTTSVGALDVIGSTSTYGAIAVIDDTGRAALVDPAGAHVLTGGYPASFANKNFGVAATWLPAGMRKVSSGTDVVSDNYQLFNGDTGLQLSGTVDGPSNMLLDEIVVWPIFASDAGLQAQAHVY